MMVLRSSSCMCVHVFCVLAYVWVYMWRPVHVDPDARESSSYPLRQGSQSNQQLPDKAPLGRQVALSIFCIHLLRLGLQAGQVFTKLSRDPDSDLHTCVGSALTTELSP